MSEMIEISSGENFWFSAVELARLGGARVIDFPRHEKSARAKAKRLGWKQREVPCKGGKHGYKAEFSPPKDILGNIQEFLTQNPDFFIKSKPEPSSKPYPVSRAKPLITGREQHNGLTVQDHSIADMRVNDFIPMPKYTLKTQSDNHRQMIRSDQVVDYLAFKKDWVEMSFNIHNNSLALITVKGDSMEPTLKSGDLILIELIQSRIEDNSLYVLQLDNDLVVKRIQRKINGSLLVKSDNPKYEPEEVDARAAKKLHVIGKVVWFGRRI
ncbi:S24 family peptidase [Nitrosomonas sp. Nm166]|uniref:S24 family peptidase n=1 Tax=Nitrosomonas sp. Nm166 TaxID=1881054 RepID=UPI0008DEB42E|nr:S24 family peptidase [Nitrosomonas sp. Nm166]SFD83931.1 Peptidase S24-like [Nitrosomonas sp. Nm166]